MIILLIYIIININQLRVLSTDEIPRYGVYWGDSNDFTFSFNYSPTYIQYTKNIMKNINQQCDRYTRYILYDVKIGEGFNLQKDVFYRMAYAVKMLNDHIRNRCTLERWTDCVTWVLVLPPFCKVAHWWKYPVANSTQLKWGSIFNMEVVMSVVGVIEYFHWTMIHNHTGGGSVDNMLSMIWSGKQRDASGTMWAKYNGLDK
eukprot:GHVR01174033.1.p1 GENE.GHVR01174033.1~~GHVR01174033.1.p1  ORF type:complete len:202 (+),score=34.65 GHVR01174033.1:127-732(+)